ncbi:hypothetical protein [Bacillus sp. Hm123]|uniref:hypothetical protein n=1 Tax=Bacillus sp. Hm123 TaxID=3450745 RepID=UPI003F42BC97
MKSSGGITIDINSSKFSQKLKAIAKHAKALAEELDEIEKSFCPQCGGQLGSTKLFSGCGVVEFKEIKCQSCGYEDFESKEGESE